MTDNDKVEPLTAFAKDTNGDWFLVLEHLRDDYFTGVGAFTMLPSQVVMFEIDPDSALISKEEFTEMTGN